MTKFHAVMIDETGCEFSAEIEACTKADAIDQLEEDYPECRVDVVSSPDEMRERERHIYERANWDYENPGYDYGDY